MTNTGVIISEHHIFSKGGTSLLYDVNNMNLYEISGECRDIIEAIDSGKPVENGCGEDYDMVLDALKAAGMLISEAENSPDEAESEVTSVIKAESKENIHFTHIILELANDCNLNCKYCYGDGGSYGRKREMMSLETAKKAVDFLVNNSGEGRNLGIVFFGGEPLMNFKVMKAVAHYCRAISAGTDKKFSYSMTTNGTILNDEIYEFIKENNISLTLSIDGPKNIQDCYRCYVSGKGSYDVLLPNIQKLVELKKGNLLARATVCHPNLNLNDILNELWKLKFKSIALSLVDAKETSDLYIKDEDFPVLLDEVWKLSDAYIESAKAGKHHPYFLLDAIIQDIYEKYEKRIACGAGRGAIAIGTDGKFYPCQRFMGMEDYVIGSLDTGIDRNGITEFRKLNIGNIEGCGNCWARHLCGGGCIHSSVKQNGTIHKPASHYCDYYKKIYEIGLYTYWKLKEWENDIFRRRFEHSEMDHSENAIAK